ncbi:unnamed protein product [Rhizophagus irregularis]|nr:unnamed protein product [Rhizophagus irregularis]
MLRDYKIQLYAKHLVFKRIKSKENHERAENILSNNEEETFSKEIHKKNLELELKEKEIILREREIKTQVAEAETRMMEVKAEALEIENQQKR